MSSSFSSDSPLPSTPPTLASSVIILPFEQGDMALVEKQHYRDCFIRVMQRNTDLSDQLLAQQRVIGELRLQNERMQNVLRQYDISIVSDTTPNITSAELLPDETPAARAHRHALLRIIAESQTAIKVFSTELKRENERLSPKRAQQKRIGYSDTTDEPHTNNKRNKK